MDLLTTKQLAEAIGKTVATVCRVAKKLDLPRGSVIMEGKKKYFSSAVVELFRAYFRPPQGWLTIEQLKRKAPKHQRRNLNYWLLQLDGYKSYYKKCENVFYYDPVLLDLLEKLPSRIKYLTLKKQPPEGVEWLTLLEFCALFGKTKHSGVRWYTEIIPRRHWKKEGGKIYIRAIATKYIDGKVRDGHCRRNAESDQGRVDFSKLILLDGYLLTEDQHRRRLEIKARGLANLKFEK